MQMNCSDIAWYRFRDVTERLTRNGYSEELEDNCQIKHSGNESPEGRTGTLGKSSVLVV